MIVSNHYLCELLVIIYASIALLMKIISPDRARFCDGKTPNVYQIVPTRNRVVIVTFFCFMKQSWNVFESKPKSAKQMFRLSRFSVDCSNSISRDMNKFVAEIVTFKLSTLQTLRKFPHSHKSELVFISNFLESKIGVTLPSFLIFFCPATLFYRCVCSFFLFKRKEKAVSLYPVSFDVRRVDRCSQ